MMTSPVKKRAVQAFIASLQGKQIHVVGLSGIEGYTIAAFLVEHGLRGLVLHDFHTQEEFSRQFNTLHLYKTRKERRDSLLSLEQWPCTICYKDEYLDGLDEADVLFLSQNWFAYPPNHPVVDRVLENGHAEVLSLTALYMMLIPAPIIGITGSVGKSTVSLLTCRFLTGLTSRLSGFGGTVYLGGNDRRSGQLLSALDQMTVHDTAVLEVSNRQLKLGIMGSPEVGVITNIMPNHIDDHGDFEHYRDIKLSLLTSQKPGDVAVLNSDDPILNEWSPAAGSSVVWFGLHDSGRTGVFLRTSEIILRTTGGVVHELLPASAIQLKGAHNTVNILAAIAAVHAHWTSLRAGGDEVAFVEALRSAVAETLAGFAGLIGRMEFVREHEGVKYYYDIKSTIPQGTVAAITTLREESSRIILIAGGGEKGVDYAALGDSIARQVCVVILLPGAGTDKIRASIPKEQENVLIVNAATFDEAWQAIETHKKAGDAVLLSPACTGFLSGFLHDTIGFKERVKAL